MENNIETFIEELLQAFPEVFSKYNSYERDGRSFYMLGVHHSPIFYPKKFVFYKNVCYNHFINGKEVGK